MKVSPECFIQLCQRVNIVHKGNRKGILLEPKSKGQGIFVLLEAQVKGTGNYCVIRAQVKGTGIFCMKVQVKRRGRYIIGA